MKNITYSLAFLSVALLALPAAAREILPDPDAKNPAVKPRVVTEPVRHDTDDPAIWINRADPAQSLVLGTDKDADGALFVFGLDGKIRHELTVRALDRPNNVDIAYDVMIGGKKRDIAVVTERYPHRLRVFGLPDMAPLDGGGIPVFEGELARDCMGIALWTRPVDGALFAFVSRSDFQAPREGYLHQYRLVDDGTGTLRGLLTRRFGSWSGSNEIESLAVDQELGFLYASDETFGVRKYLADPLAEDAEEQLARIGPVGFSEDREGISIYPTGPGKGYILVSNQSSDTFRIFAREGAAVNPHEHPLVASVRVSTMDSDGSDITNVELPGFPGGLFVAMSTDRTFHFYAWDDLAKAVGLK